MAACPNSVSACNNVCDASSLPTWTCITAVNGHGDPAEVWAVYDASGSTICGDDYCIWGTDNSGAGFCCTLTPGPGLSGLDIEIFTDSQTPSQDTVRLRYFSGSSYELSDDGTLMVTALVDTGFEDDTIVGSNSASADYKETLFGGPDDDDITANDGEDDLDGGDGDDTCDGGGDVDNIVGGAGVDILSGGGGADVMDGEADEDILYGGFGADTISGGTQSDDLCGQQDGDGLYGEDGDDDMWGEGGTDYGSGGNDVDQCEAFGDTYASCFASLTSSPCP